MRITSSISLIGTRRDWRRSASTSSSRSIPINCDTLPRSSPSTRAVRASPLFSFSTANPQNAVWDLAFFGRQDRSNELSTEIPLNHARVAWWQKRMVNLLHHVQDTWPDVPVWLRKLHRVGPVSGASCAFPPSSVLLPHSLSLFRRAGLTLLLLHRRLATRCRRERRTSEVLQLLHRRADPPNPRDAAASRAGGRRAEFRFR